MIKQGVTGSERVTTRARESDFSYVLDHMSCVPVIILVPADIQGKELFFV